MLQKINCTRNHQAREFLAYSTPTKQMIMHSGKQKPSIIVNVTISNFHLEMFCDDRKKRERDIRPFGIRGSTVCTNSIVWLSQQLLQLAHCGCLKSPKSIIDLTPFRTHLVTCNVLLSCLQQLHLTHLWLCFETDPSKNTF
jgi:hypothetical protein